MWSHRTFSSWSATAGRYGTLYTFAWNFTRIKNYYISKVNLSFHVNFFVIALLKNWNIVIFRISPDATGIKLELYINGELLDQCHDNKLLSEIPIRHKSIITGKVYSVSFILYILRVCDVCNHMSVLKFVGFCLQYSWAIIKRQFKRFVNWWTPLICWCTRFGYLIGFFTEFFGKFFAGCCE